MDRPVARSRALYTLILLSQAVMCYGVGADAVPLPPALRSAAGESREMYFATFRFEIVLSEVGLLFLIRIVVLTELPQIVRNCRWLLLRPVIFWELAGLVGFIAGMVFGAGSVVGSLLIGLGAGYSLFLAIYTAHGGEEKLPVTSTGFFLLARGHFDDYSARRHLVAIFAHVFLVSAALTMLLRGAPDADAVFPARAQTFSLAVAVAMLITTLQVNPQRGLSFLHFGIFAIFVGALVHAIDPTADWPAALVGVGAGLPFCGLTTALLMHVPSKQRFAAMLIADFVIVVAALLGYCVRFLPHERAAWSLAALSFAVFGGFLRLYFREFAEIIQEIVHWPMYRFKTYGPGLYLVPTRGPVLIVANHGAYFDPLFVAKVMPLRLRAWMISTMFDKPFLKWLAGDVYGAVRVPDRPGFRRHMPEIDAAIQILSHGENMMIFPEAWLRRKEEQPLHRFAQGIFHILKACPGTVVLPAWIEDSWGSYLSYKNGPPTKGKPFDWFYKIRMGFGEPEVLPPELFDDHKAMRKYLMERVLHCRTYLGLPPHPVPGLTSIEDEKEN